MRISAELLGLLRDAKANPDDLGLRQILADWLEEHGDPERAEFVRLDCRGWIEERTARRDSLMASNLDAWIRPLEVRELTIASSRGLLKVCGPSRYLLSRELAQRDCIPELAWIESLELRNLTAAESPALATSPHWTCLNQLHVENTQGNIDANVSPEFFGHSPHDWSAFRDFPSRETLRSLSFRSLDLGAAGLAALLAHPFPELRRLVLHAANLGDAGAEALARSSCLPRLRSLEIVHSRVGSAGWVALADWPGLATLERLIMQDNYPGEEGVAALARSPLCHSLTDWDLTALSRYFNDQMPGRCLGPAGAIALATAPQPFGRLRRLSLAEHRIGVEGARALASSRVLPSLTALNLSANSLGDEGVRALVAAPWLPNLRELHLSQNGLTDEGALALLDAPPLPELTALNLISNMGMSVPIRQRLRQRFGENLWL